MVGNNFLYLAVFSTNLIYCLCYVGYDLFRGFEFSPVNDTTETPGNLSTPRANPHQVFGKTTSKPKTVHTVTENKTTINGTARKEIDFITANDEYNEEGHWNKKPKIKVKQFLWKCPENEKPQSIGTYEIPTQRDLVLFTQRTMLKMFNSYHQKTLLLLKDIKEATRATVAIEKKCFGSGKTLYKKCVREVSKKCITITKVLVQSLEHQEAEVIALTENKICNMTSMRTDPIQLIKTLAMDEAMLEFALPAFLRLLGGCNVHCHKPPQPDHRPRLRKLTDQDLVVRHLLTKKNYVQLLKDTHKYV